MILDRDIYEAAQRVIDRHGKSAHYYASLRMREAEDSEDKIGTEAWRQIAAAVEEIERDIMLPDERIN